jgi:hypothetical protein
MGGNRCLAFGGSSACECDRAEPSFEVGQQNGVANRADSLLKTGGCAVVSVAVCA